MVGCIEAGIDTLLNLSMINTNFLLRNQRTLFRDETKALRVYLLNIIPPLRLMTTLFDHFVDTMLSEVLIDNIFTRNFMELVFDMIRGTVETIAEALFLLEVCCASWTTPRHETRRNIYISLQPVCISIEFLDKVE